MASPRLLPASLTGRLLAATVALLAAACLLIAVAATLIMRSYLMDRLDRDVVRSLDRGPIVFIGQPPGTTDLQSEGSTPRPPQGSRDGSLAAVITSTGYARGTQFTTSGELRVLTATELTALARAEIDRTPRTFDVPGLGSYRVAAGRTSNGNIQIQGVPTADVDATIRTLLWWEIGLGLAGVGAAAVAGRIIVRRQLRPLREVAATAERVTRLDLASGEVGHTDRVAEDLTDPTTEVGQVGGALNRLLGHVEDALVARHESEQQVRQFLADASHELRTPLATIRGYAELSRRIPADENAAGELAGVLGKVDVESARMTRLVEDMLLLARLDAGRELEPARLVDLSRLVTEAVHDAAVVDPHRTWEVELPVDPVAVEGDEHQLHQLVTNLLGNASRHTPAGTCVTTSLEPAASEIRLVVADDGPDGIDAALLPTIFDRFVRGDPASRTRSSGGAGLGTSLVRAIAHAHGGNATVTSSPGDTRFLVTLPVAPSPPGRTDRAGTR